MGRTRALALLPVVTAALLLAPDVAQACECPNARPVLSETFWTSTAVFVGRVTAISPVGREGTPGSHRVRFAVSEALRGTTVHDIDIVSGPTSCDIQFSLGEEWLIYAFPIRDGSGLTTHVCSRSAPLDRAAADIAYGRAAVRRTAEKRRIFGTLTYAHQRDPVGVSGIPVTLSGNGTPPVAAVTGRDGRYEFRVPAGRYRVTASPIPGMTVVTGGQDIHLADNRGCAMADLYTEYPGRVHGRVLDAARRPVPNVAVELVAADGLTYAPNSLRAITDNSGRYSFSEVEPGSYTPGVIVGTSGQGLYVVPLYAFGGQTTSQKTTLRTVVSGGADAAAGDLVLPERIRLVQVVGTVVHEDGRPAVGAKVRTKADVGVDGFPWTTVRADAQGAFAFALVAGLKHRVVAEPKVSQGQGDRRIVDPDQPLTPLRLVLR